MVSSVSFVNKIFLFSAFDLNPCETGRSACVTCLTKEILSYENNLFIVFIFPVKNTKAGCCGSLTDVTLSGISFVLTDQLNCIHFYCLMKTMIPLFMSISGNRTRSLQLIRKIKIKIRNMYKKLKKYINRCVQKETNSISQNNKTLPLRGKMLV